MLLHRALVAALVLCACGKSALNLNLAGHALHALPAIPGGANLTAGGALPGDFTLHQFFKLQCHSTGDNAVDNCPPGVPADGSTVYDAQTLLGLIYAVDRETGDIFNSGHDGCSAGEGAGPLSASAASFVSTGGGNGSRFLLDTYALLGCAGHRTTPAAKVFAYSAGASPLALIAARKHDLYSPGWDQTDVYQIYVSQDAAGANRLLAYNEASIESTSGYAQRAVLLVNFATRRFLVQYRQQGEHAFLTAAGTGGLSPAGAYEPGAYFVRTGGTIGDGTAGVCVDNVTRTQADPSACAAEQAAWSGPADVAAYLGATPAEQADLAPFLARFAGGGTARDLAVNEAPASAADVADMPDAIR